jgi:hypothetical protein
VHDASRPTPNAGRGEWSVVLLALAARGGGGWPAWTRPHGTARSVYHPSASRRRATDPGQSLRGRQVTSPFGQAGGRQALGICRRNEGCVGWVGGWQRQPSTWHGTALAHRWRRFPAGLQLSPAVVIVPACARNTVDGGRPQGPCLWRVHVGEHGVATGDRDADSIRAGRLLCGLQSAGRCEWTVAARTHFGF